MQFKAIIFDLDGTLLDTLDDLAYSFNYACSEFGCQNSTVSEYRQLIGKGARNVIQKIFDKNTITYDDNHLNKCLQLCRKTYLETGFKHTYPYRGITTLLPYFINHNVRLAVFSNKPHDNTVKMVSQFFPTIPFEIVLGHKEENPLKPDPIITTQLLSNLNLAPKDVAMIGDSRVDIQTGKRVGMCSIAVTWGFRERDHLLHENPNVIVDTPQEIITFLED